MTDRSPLLDVRHLTTIYDSPSGPLPVVDDVSLRIAEGETLALVGESGSGKSLTALSILRLVQPPGRVARGEVLFRGRDLRQLDEGGMRRVRGREIALIFQEPAAALNPVFTIGAHVAEGLEVHGLASGSAAWSRAVECLAEAGIPDAAGRARDYPHQLSGGLLQRAVIAAALACRPALVIADEPTSALDATLQAQILALLRRLRSALGLSLLLITHDLDILPGTADRVAVMYAGRLVEQGRTADVLRAPAHPYTRALLDAVPAGRAGRLRAIAGHAPPPGHPAKGCAFAPRCDRRVPECERAAPGITDVAEGRRVRCHLCIPAGHA
ncbi:MAG TPA: ABC transporter ATP-binding protein [Vicinamibacterales bacterium]|nr:ABC transporter ATP-binding protein [Vicinamibacterales bacterium]